ncbi:HpcH/HpaI aldolase/citrate lyase family protein [Croceicoccus mobilis]|uniref:Citrate lyase subunit beta n=1 Tax=Croceicoccus mobilis TaxID=1703339 RepID=A0A916YU98_9SPHN|nr:CoA ester lyase [Croceicoccus mobilis]GGD60623.1 citrate lyase subunit beta [Croceicoccus mobilis]
MPNPNPIVRSALSMPGSNARALEKARSLPADCIIIDLEDAVAAEAKTDARALVVESLAAGGLEPRYRVVRINPLDGEWGAEDLRALAHSDLDAILVPKVSSAEEVVGIASQMAQAGFHGNVALWVMIETAASVLALERIAATSESTPLAGLVLGANDLAKETGMLKTPGREAFSAVLSQCVMAARAHGLVAIDSVLNAIGDDDRLEAECRQGRLHGFDGKMLIHPGQIAITNRVYAPSDDAIAEARAIVAAFEAPENAGKAVVKVGGQMAEELHRDEALALLARAEAIAARE